MIVDIMLYFFVTIGILKIIKYSVLLILLILVELGLSAFMFFDKSWKEVSFTKFVIFSSTPILWGSDNMPTEQEIPTDRTGNFDTIYEFLEKHWEIIKWVALGALILQVNPLAVFLIAICSYVNQNVYFIESFNAVKFFCEVAIAASCNDALANNISYI